MHYGLDAFCIEARFVVLISMLVVELGGLTHMFVLPLAHLSYFMCVSWQVVGIYIRGCLCAMVFVGVLKTALGFAPLSLRGLA